VIEIDNLVFEYPSKRALHGVSVAVKSGAIAALVGPNGAGKTTLLRCIAALERPFSGTVRIDGLDVQVHPRQIHARLGFLPDFYGLYDELTVRRALTFAAKAHGIGPAQVAAAVEKAVRRVGLSDRMDERAATLSRGLRQRLGIGQAIVHEPQVLLLDEPASGLDPDSRRALSRLLLELQAQGMTLIVSSHILSELEDYSSEMIIMEEGRIAGGAAKRVAAADAPRIGIELAEPRPDLPAFLAARAGVTVVRADAQRAVIAVTGGAAERHLLLKALLEAGFPVADFAVQKVSLEDLYFEEIDGTRRPS
jgi:ABC-2 type transport system ATP-binding protein